MSIRIGTCASSGPEPDSWARAPAVPDVTIHWSCSHPWSKSTLSIRLRTVSLVSTQQAGNPYRPAAVSSPACGHSDTWRSALSWTRCRPARGSSVRPATSLSSFSWSERRFRIWSTNRWRLGALPTGRTLVHSLLVLGACHARGRPPCAAGHSPCVRRCVRDRRARPRSGRHSARAVGADRPLFSCSGPPSPSNPTRAARRPCSASRSGGRPRGWHPKAGPR